MSKPAVLEATSSLHRESQPGCIRAARIRHTVAVMAMGDPCAEGVTYLHDWVCVEGDDGLKGRGGRARVFPRAFWGRTTYDHGALAREIRGCAQG